MKGIVWHQSTIAELLSCPKRFEFRYVLKVPLDHTLTGYAKLLGTADHAGLELVVTAANDGRVADRDELRDRVLEAFEGAIHEAQDAGESTDPDGLDRAFERLEGERLDRLVALAEDPRIHAIEWHGIEWTFAFSERNGRRWEGTLDVWGVATRYVPGFGALGKDQVDLEEGDGVIVDWKTGECPPFGWVERQRSVQLGVYGMALANTPIAGHAGANRWRTFLGIVRDVDKPKAPTDEQGKRIPKRLPKQLNPLWVEATADPTGKSKKRPKDADGNAIPKWMPEQLNPAWEDAVSRPKGPVFREAIVRYELVLETVRDAIRMAELGIFPASGAVTGQCGRCPYASICTNYHDQENQR